MRLIIVSDYPFLIEKSGYANQCNLLLPKIIDNYSDIEIIFIPISITVEKNYYKLLDYKFLKDNLNFDYKKEKYIQKIKFYLLKSREEIFKAITHLDNEIKLNEKDKIFFYCDLNSNISIDNNIKATTYYWYPCHFSFNDKIDGIYDNELFLKLKKDEEVNLKKILYFFDKIATFSTYGTYVLDELNYDTTFINHCLNDKLYYNLNNKNELRKKYNISNDSYLCLIIGRNNDITDRKSFKENLEGFKLFCNKVNNPNIYLILHTLFLKGKDKVDLIEIINDLDISDRIITIPNHLIELNDKQINELYNISDVLLCCSKVEGFGLTPLEAQYSGLPVVVTDCTAMVDNLYNGIKTKPKIVSNVVNGINSFSLPDPIEIGNALVNIYNKNYEKKEIPKKNYNIDYVFKDWVRFLNLQDNNDIINLQEKKILFVLTSKENLIHNINKIRQIYSNYSILIIQKDDDIIYNQIISLRLNNILISKNNKSFLHNYKLIYNDLEYYDFYFFINNIKIDKLIENIISNKMYYTRQLINNKINKQELSNLFLKDDLKNDFILSNTLTYYNENLLVSSENLYKIIRYFENIDEDKLNQDAFNIIFSFYLSQQNSVVLD